MTTINGEWISSGICAHCNRDFEPPFRGYTGTCKFCKGDCCHCYHANPCIKIYNQMKKLEGELHERTELLPPLWNHVVDYLWFMNRHMKKDDLKTTPNKYIHNE
jgi:hypothetical protein